VANWRDTITDPKLKNIAERIASPADAIKALYDTRNELTQRIKVPGEGSTEEEVKTFRKAIGVPDTVEGYEVTLADGMTMNDQDKMVLQAVAPLALEEGVPKAAFNRFVGRFMELSKNAEQQLVTQIKQFGEQAETQLRKEWGADYEKNVNLSTRVRDAIGGPEMKAFFNETLLPGGKLLGDHPIMVKFMATIARRTMDEGEMMLGHTPEEKKSIQSQIDDLNKAVPVGSPGYTTQAHQQKLQGLYDKLYGKDPIVGSAGRQL
jgi:hypothetical protein